MKKYLIILISLLFSYGLFPQGVYNNGGKIVIGSGVYFIISGTGGNYRNDTNVTNASIDLLGILKIEGDYTNNVVGSDILSTVATGSEVVFDGTTNQTIGGSTTAAFVFSKLTINKISNSILLQKDIQINDTLRFTNGNIDIGNNNLAFGQSSVVAGNPSAASMIVATGNGQVKKIWSAVGAFTFPIGDSNITAEYSPVSLNFTTGTFAAGAFVGLNLVNLKYNDTSITGSYLNRYWNISQTGITGFTCDAVFQYLSSDVSGTESNISCYRVVPTPITIFNPSNVTLHQLSASGLTFFGTFTGGPYSTNKTLSIKLYLEGLYAGGGLMSQAQGNAGNQFSGNTADQISVELHDPVTYLTQVYSASNVDLNTSGLASISIPGTYSGSYYITIKHRNSIATVSASPLAFSSQTINYDFTTSQAQAFGSNLKFLATGIYGLYAGDVNGDGVVDVLDLSSVQNDAVLFSSGYLLTDINGDGVVDIFDINLVQNNSLLFISAVTP
ncbi:MAG: dockerin type I domain-containing protein [Bacteroidales bacterium]|jgi:hypothetical protein